MMATICTTIRLLSVQYAGPSEKGTVARVRSHRIDHHDEVVNDGPDGNAAEGDALEDAQAALAHPAAVNAEDPKSQPLEEHEQKLAVPL